jgi:transposase
MDETKTKKKARGQPVVFPNIFTVEELGTTHPEIVRITLRYKINTAIDRGVITQIGTIHRPVGRPHVVFVKEPISKSTFEALRDKGVKIYEDKEKKFKEFSDSAKVIEQAMFSDKTKQKT